MSNSGSSSVSDFLESTGKLDRETIANTLLGKLAVSSNVDKDGALL